jgi:ribosomal protein S27AE
LPDPKTLGLADWTEVGATPFRQLEGGSLNELHGKYRLEFFKKGIVFKAEQFDTLIDVCFASIPVDRRRVCPAPGCTTPYFVAHHLKQIFCGKDECIQWGRRKLKREYWERNKARLLAKRKRERSGGNNVARKAR